MSKPKVTQDVPPMREHNQNLSGLKALPAEGFNVLSWSSGNVGENVPASEVHVTLPIPHTDILLVLRLKSPRALDELVGVLLQHRADVWGAEP